MANDQINAEDAGEVVKLTQNGPYPS